MNLILLIVGAFASAFALITVALVATGARVKKPKLVKLDQHGEGVISAAIAVLIIASLGALMWVGFKSLWENAEATTNSEIAKIGQ